MATGLEIALVKPVVDALMALFKKSKTSKLRADANVALSEAIRELLLASPNLRSAETKIAVAKAQGIISADLVLAEEMVLKHYTSGKGPVSKKAAAKNPPAKKPAVKKPVAKRFAAKKA